MESEERSRSTIAILERPVCAAVVSNTENSNRTNCQPGHDNILHSHTHHRHHHHHHVSNSTVRNIEIDWREVDPYFSELSDCASFWTLINFTCDVIYSGLFVLFFIMGQDVESMFFEGLLNHINPILIYLILSLITNYGALRSLRCGREKCFLVFSISKALLFPITISLLLYLVFCDVKDYFGTFWVSFVVIVSCYNSTAALGLWSMFTCNKYILVNEAAQKRIRKEAKQQQRSVNETDCRCGCTNLNSSTCPSSSNYGANQCSSSRSSSSHHQRKVGDSSCTNNVVLVCKPESSINSNFTTNINKTFTNHKKENKLKLPQPNKNNGNGTNGITSAQSSSRSKAKKFFDNDDDDELSSLSYYGEDDEVLQVSTIHM